MISLLRAEWLKIRNFRPFWVVCCAYPLCLGGIVGMSLWGQKRVQDYAEGTNAAGTVAANLPFGYPMVWHSVAYIASWLHVIAAALLILHVTNEFNFRTHRQNLLDGWSRAQFLLAKLGLALLISLACVLTVGIFSLAAGTYTGMAPSPAGGSFVGLFFLQCCVYQTLALLMAFLIRRGALAVVAFFMYAMMVEPIAAFFINLRTDHLGAYLPLRVANALVPFPYLQENAPEAAKALLGSLPQSTLVAGSAAYLAVFAVLMWLRYQREDL